MSIKTYEEVLSMFPLTPAEVEIQVRDNPTFNILLKPLTSAERDAFEASVVGVKGKTELLNLRARLVQKCWVTPEGKPVRSAQDMGNEARSDLAVVLFDKVRELNGMDKDVAQVEKEKND